MTFNFVDEETSEVKETAQQIDRILAKEPDKELDFDEAMTEAEKRFAKAQFYRTLLVDFGFDDDSPTAQAVVDEIRGFVKERLAVLLGVKPEVQHQAPVPSDFSPEEVKLLKQVASRLLKKPEIAQIEPPKAPTVRNPQGPGQIKLKQNAKETPKAAVAPKEADKTKKPVGRPKKEQETRTGEYLEIDGKRYEKAIDARGEHYVGPDGQKFLISKNEGGQFYLRNVTPPGVPSGVKPIPPLSADMIAAISARHVRQAIKQDPVAGSGQVNLEG